MFIEPGRLGKKPAVDKVSSILELGQCSKIQRYRGLVLDQELPLDPRRENRDFFRGDRGRPGSKQKAERHRQQDGGGSEEFPPWTHWG